MKAPHTTSPGFTLLELLLYIALIGGLLTTVIAFLGTSVEARVKNQSIAEVNDQGIAAMDYITQAVRNATAINTPTTAGNGATLSINTPTASPTIFDASGSATLGVTTDGGSTDDTDNNYVTATKFTAGVTGTVSTLYALIGPTVSAAPNNKGQMAIYTGTTSPSTLLASSGDTALAPNSWNAFSISPVTVTSGQNYWIAYNTNAASINDNNLRYVLGSAGEENYMPQTYGTWPASWTGTTSNFRFSVYASVNTANGVSALEVKKGASSFVPLTSNDVAISGLTFKNLGRSGTNGIIQISFTLSRVNNGGRNEYDYQKTFTSTAEVGW